MAYQPIAPHVSCMVYQIFEGVTQDFDAAIADGYQEIYLVTPSGIIKHQRLRPGKDGKIRYIQLPVKAIPGVKELPKFVEIGAEINFLPDGKIPYRLLDEVKAFFKKVIEKRGTAVEAMIWVLWNQTAGYHLFVPPQRVSHASATYDWSSVPVGSSIIVDIHSHANFSAFFSGTDNRDDKGSIRYSGVIGHNDTNAQDMVWRFNCLPDPVEQKLSDIFGPQVLPEHHVPESWLDKVQAPEKTTYTGGTYGKGTSIGYPGGHNFSHGRVGGAGVGAEAGGERVWKGAQYGRLNHGAWSKQIDSHIEIDQETGVITSKSQGKGGKKNSSKKGSGVQSALNLSDDETQGVDRGVVADMARSLMSGKSEDELIKEAEAEYLRIRRIPDDANLSTSIDFTDNVLDYGTDAAFAAEDISLAIDQLAGSDDLLASLARKAFVSMSEEEKLAAFRRLYEELPKTAQDTLANDGF